MAEAEDFEAEDFEAEGVPGENLKFILSSLAIQSIRRSDVFDRGSESLSEVSGFTPPSSGFLLPQWMRREP